MNFSMLRSLEELQRALYKGSLCSTKDPYEDSFETLYCHHDMYILREHQSGGSRVVKESTGLQEILPFLSYEWYWYSRSNW